MVVERISDLDVGVCLAPKECSSVWPYNFVGHNEDIVSA